MADFIEQDGKHYIEVNGEFKEVEPLTVAIGALIDQVHMLLPRDKEAEIEPFKAALSHFVAQFLDAGVRMSSHFLASTYQVAEQRLDDHEERIEALEQQRDDNA